MRIDSIADIQQVERKMNAELTSANRNFTLKLHKIVATLQNVTKEMTGLKKTCAEQEHIIMQKKEEVERSRKVQLSLNEEVHKLQKANKSLEKESKEIEDELEWLKRQNLLHSGKRRNSRR